MKIFLDTCDIGAIKKYNDIGLIDGITTNPSIISASGNSLDYIIPAICEIIKTSVSVEIIATEIDDMIDEAMQYCKWGEQITIKLPITENGLYACKKLSMDGISVNMTLCFSGAQAILAAKAGAEYVSPFIGRLDDIGQNGLHLIHDICVSYANYPNLQTKVIAASIRNITHFIESAKFGSDIATVTPKMLNALMHHDLTQQGVEIFLNDWKNAGQNSKLK